MPDRYPPPNVLAKVKRFDRALDLRWCGDRWGLYRLGTRIGSVAPELLGDGSMLLSKLYHTDILRQHGSAENAANFLDRTEAEATAKRHAHRRAELIDESKESYDDLARLAGRRINNAWIPGGTR